MHRVISLQGSSNNLLSRKKVKMSVNTARTEWLRCFLCHSKSPLKTGYKYLDASDCRASKKSIKDVLKHLAAVAKTELLIPSGEWLCRSCHAQLVDYDDLMVRMLHKQRKLRRMVERAATTLDSDFEKECQAHMAALEDLEHDDIMQEALLDDMIIEQSLDDASQSNDDSRENKSNDDYHERKSDCSAPKIPRELLQCSFCAMRFRSKVRLHKHIAKAHKKYSCELCPFTHRNQDYVLLHMNLHEGRIENQCRFCYKTFTTKISTIRHMEVHLHSKKYQCDKCGLCFSQTTVLYNHRLQHEAEEQPLRCEICSQIFKTKRTYRHHMITHRADRPRYSCEYCAKTFTEKYTLKVHTRTHQQQDDAPKPMATMHPSVTEPKFNCIICKQRFHTKDLLNRHMEKEHDVIIRQLHLTNYTQYEEVNEEQRAPCHICGQMFGTAANRNLHMMQVHGSVGTE